MLADEQMTPLVSIVVPFFNIEAYAQRCLDSILAQTFEDFEIVCIDDGSTDGTARILDALGDSRIRVFHTENRGLSAARNFGVKQARGRLVSFVDGDDCIAPCYLQLMVRALGENGGESTLIIGDCRIIKEGEERGILSYDGRDAIIENVSKTDYFGMLLYEEVLPSACAKLASRKLYLTHPFPEGRRYEEISTIARFLEESERLLLVRAPIYGYFMRAGSIVHAVEPKASQICDYKIALSEFLESVDLQVFIPGSARFCFLTLHYLRMANLMNRVHPDDSGAYIEQEREFISAYLKDHEKKVLEDDRVAKSTKLRLRLFNRSPKAYYAAMKAYERWVKRV